MGTHQGAAVNFYKHHLGDYDAATAHLSWDEDQAYTRLLRVYYRTEKPLPRDPDLAYRLVRAITRAQKAAVTAVLHEFFDERADGWHNKRADEEIAAYRIETAGNSDRRDNEKERQRRHRERRKRLFDDLREHGITAPWDASTEELQTALSRVTCALPERDPSQPATRDATAIHKPDTRSHAPEAINQNPAVDVVDLSKAVGGERSDSTPAPDSSATDKQRPVRELVQATAAGLTRRKFA